MIEVVNQLKVYYYNYKIFSVSPKVTNHKAKPTVDTQEKKKGMRVYH